MTHEHFKAVGCIHDRVVEECSELIKAIMKANRFGYSNYHPDHPGRQNWMDIIEEIDDVRRTCDEYEQALRKNFP